MITRVSHITFFVLDQEKAYQFYVEKLGFKVNTDAKMENGFRWLTITLPDQPISKLHCSIPSPAV
jgi:catechol 2,3-dioxygenase-like lactoylglutathione lyase family enzyme